MKIFNECVFIPKKVSYCTDDAFISFDWDEPKVSFERCHASEILSTPCPTSEIDSKLLFKNWWS